MYTHCKEEELDRPSVEKVDRRVCCSLVAFVGRWPFRIGYIGLNNLTDSVNRDFLWIWRVAGIKQGFSRDHQQFSRNLLCNLKTLLGAVVSRPSMTASFLRTTRNFYPTCSLAIIRYRLLSNSHLSFMLGFLPLSSSAILLCSEKKSHCREKTPGFSLLLPLPNTEKNFCVRKSEKDNNLVFTTIED